MTPLRTKSLAGPDLNQLVQILVEDGMAVRYNKADKQYRYKTASDRIPGDELPVVMDPDTENTKNTKNKLRGWSCCCGCFVQVI